MNEFKLQQTLSCQDVAMMGHMTRGTKETPFGPPPQVPQSLCGDTVSGRLFGIFRSLEATLVPSDASQA